MIANRRCESWRSCRDSCGYSVPLYSFEGHRSRLLEWAGAKSDEQLVAYRDAKNAASIDGLDALLAPTVPETREYRLQYYEAEAPVGDFTAIASR